MVNIITNIGVFLVKATLFLSIAGLGCYVTYYMVRQLITAHKAPKAGTMFAYIFFMFMATMMLFSFVSQNHKNETVQAQVITGETQDERCKEAQGDIEANSCLFNVISDKREIVTSEIEKLQTLQHAYDLQLRGLNTENNALRSKKE